jgi:hypothetical protein
MRARSSPLACPARLALVVLVVLLAAGALHAAAQPAPEQPPLSDLALEGATVYTRDDVLWLLELRIGGPLREGADRIAEQLQGHYREAGYRAATVKGEYDAAAGRLTLHVDEGRVDDIEITGLPADSVSRFRERLDVFRGSVYNTRHVGEHLDPLFRESGGALRLGKDGIDLVTRNGRRVLVVPIESRGGAASFGLSTEGREDFFSPVDGFAPAISIDLTRFDAERFRHTFASGYVSYKFGREDPGYAAGVEQVVLVKPALFVGASVHDLSASDDMWRLTATEQSLVSLTFKNTFRDYYRRRGTQVHAAYRPHPDHEIITTFRWDRHEPLVNSTDFSFFRDDHPYRPNTPIESGKVRSLVLGYSWDSRGQSEPGPDRSYSQHLLDDLYRTVKRQASGARVDWTSEIAGHGFGGDREFDRHILNARAYVPMTRRQSVAGRMLLGFSGGTLPVEREFAIGGIGSVHGYAFKEARGRGLALFNAEYRLDLLGNWHKATGGILRGLLFYDAGRIDDPIAGSRTDWLQGIGVGLQTGPLRVEFGFRLDDIPDSRQVLVRLGTTF